MMSIDIVNSGSNNRIANTTTFHCNARVFKANNGDALKAWHGPILPCLMYVPICVSFTNTNRERRGGQPHNKMQSSKSSKWHGFDDLHQWGWISKQWVSILKYPKQSLPIPPTRPITQMKPQPLQLSRFPCHPQMKSTHL